MMNSRRKLLSLIGLSETYGWTRKSLLSEINGWVITGYFTWLTEDTRRYKMYGSLLFYINYRPHFNEHKIFSSDVFILGDIGHIWTILYWYSLKTPVVLTSTKLLMTERSNSYKFNEGGWTPSSGPLIRTWPLLSRRIRLSLT